MLTERMPVNMTLPGHGELSSRWMESVLIVRLSGTECENCVPADRVKIMSAG